VLGVVSGEARKHLEVLGPVVGLVAVDVVDDLRARERSPELLFGDETMLVDVPVRGRGRMVGSEDADVPVRGRRRVATASVAGDLVAVRLEPRADVVLRREPSA
jgi:hypothetical protein